MHAFTRTSLTALINELSLFADVQVFTCIENWSFLIIAKKVTAL